MFKCCYSILIFIFFLLIENNKICPSDKYKISDDEKNKSENNNEDKKNKKKSILFAHISSNQSVSKLSYSNTSPLNPYHDKLSQKKSSQLNTNSAQVSYLNRVSRNDSFSNNNDTNNLQFRAITNSLNRKGYEVPQPAITIDKVFFESTEPLFYISSGTSSDS